MSDKLVTILAVSPAARAGLHFIGGYLEVNYTVAVERFKLNPSTKEAVYLGDRRISRREAARYIRRLKRAGWKFPRKPPFF